MIEEFYVGFHKPYLRDAEGKLSVRGMFGHCEIWGYTSDGTWLFLDPQSKGGRVRITHVYDEVNQHLAFRFALCTEILRVPADDPEFRVPVFGPLTCASICGHLLGVRALLPSTLRRKLLAKGAEVLHGRSAERGSAGQEGPAAGAPSGGDRAPFGG